MIRPFARFRLGLLAPLACFGPALASPAVADASAPAQSSSAPLARQLGQGIGGRAKAPETGESVVRTELLQLSPSIEAGKPFEVAVRYAISPKWHVYWKNAGDSGAPPAIEWSLPQGFSAGPMIFPRPTVMEHEGETTIGYEGELVIKTLITPPADKPLPEKLAVSAKLNWFVCSTHCLMGSREHTLAVARTAAATPELRGEYPQPLEAIGMIARVDGTNLVITRAPSSATPPVADGTSVRFLPDATPGVTYGATVPPAVVLRGADATLTIPLEIKPQNALGEALRAAGLITLTSADGKPAGSAEFVIPLKVVGGAADPKPSTPVNPTGGAS